MEEIDAWRGLDVGKAEHHATVVDRAGGIVFDRAVRNDEAAIERLLDAAGERAALVVERVLGDRLEHPAVRALLQR